MLVHSDDYGARLVREGALPASAACCPVVQISQLTNVGAKRELTHCLSLLPQGVLALNFLTFVGFLYLNYMLWVRYEGNLRALAPIWHLRLASA